MVYSSVAPFRRSTKQGLSGAVCRQRFPDQVARPSRVHRLRNRCSVDVLSQSIATQKDREPKKLAQSNWLAACRGMVQQGRADWMVRGASTAARAEVVKLDEASGSEFQAAGF